jgi:hypothetical protein
VGSTCLADFLGIEDASKIAASACMLAEARDICEDESTGGGFDSGECSLARYLGFVAWEMRTTGWVSRAAAQERGGQSTGDWASNYESSAKARDEFKVEVSPTDEALAAAAIAWAREQSGADNDYLYNLGVVARQGYVGRRMYGVAASMIVAYQKATGADRIGPGKKPIADAHLGTVGKRETWTATLDFVTGYETAYGYTTVLKFLTDDGVPFTWKASGNPGPGRDDVGKRYSVKGTVKSHGEYKGAKQTLVTRCVVTEIQAVKVAS